MNELESRALGRVRGSGQQKFKGKGNSLRFAPSPAPKGRHRTQGEAKNLKPL